MRLNSTQFRQKKLLNDVIAHETCLPSSFAAFYSEVSNGARIFGESLIFAPIKSETVDLVITSPPYPLMTDYIKSQRLSFNFLNENFTDYVGRETGARYRRSRRDCLTSYERDIRQINRKISNVLKIGGYFCVVLPAYDAKDTRKDVIERIIEDYTKLGMDKVFEVGRYIPSHKRTLSIQWATLVNERIYIFRKG